MPELPATAIDRGSPVPYYFQLKQVLAEQIVAGRWGPGQQVPSEPAIGQHFDVSRTTVRQALAEMQRGGLIRREKGRGTFVAERRPTESWLLQSSVGFHEEVSHAGHVVTSTVLVREIGPLPAWASESLALADGTEGMRLERVRKVDGNPVMYVHNYLPAEYGPAVFEADLERGSLYATLRRAFGLEVSSGHRVLDAVPAGEDVARHLEVAPGFSLLFVESVSWDGQRRPFECYRAWHRPDRVKIRVNVVSRELAARVGMDPLNKELALG